ncbi:RNase H1/viroplasmin domain-containing protein [Vibrio hepatarius]|uniref:RNase H1/viroplasmin domain-containing protein n=1 Tax=Vibrio hepatarius TaxID=171383 RepID=UPI001C0807E2|nr:RNase H1/viroplasmin domain-containing protein [Vibrio hepatarius]MBU2895701.1 RNase H1/viroplasmin domain-containing protein [Vibrio hepatarius]
MAKNKFYVVWKGRETGIFTSWSEVNELIKGFSGAEYKGYADRGTAELEFSQLEKLSETKSPRY